MRTVAARTRHTHGANVKQQDLFDIKGNVAFVTGAASGLGLAYAEVMAENGARVVLADIHAAALDKATERLAAAGCAVEPALVDIGDSDEIGRASCRERV